MRHTRLALSGVVLLLLSASCRTTPTIEQELAQREMLSLLMPTKIEIVEPFTGVKSFDDDTILDGIELLVRAVNAMDNPGLMIVGDVRVELYQYVPASADNKGVQYDLWNISLRSAEEQRRYWQPLTQMYEFRLRINSSKTPRANKYVIQVTYNTPLGKHLTDEIVLSYQNVSDSFAADKVSRR